MYRECDWVQDEDRQRKWRAVRCSAPTMLSSGASRACSVYAHLLLLQPQASVNLVLESSTAPGSPGDQAGLPSSLGLRYYRGTGSFGMCRLCPLLHLRHSRRERQILAPSQRGNHTTYSPTSNHRYRNTPCLFFLTAPLASEAPISRGTSIAQSP